jgi:hypothetical protein
MGSFAANDQIVYGELEMLQRLERQRNIWFVDWLVSRDKHYIITHSSVCTLWLWYRQKVDLFVRLLETDRGTRITVEELRVSHVVSVLC